MTELSLMERFADPALFDTLSIGEKMAGAGVTTLMGMGVTFAVLILLWGIISVMTRFMRIGAKKAAAPAEAAQAAPAAAIAPPAAQAVSAAAEDDSLIAVISAAIAAYEGDGPKSSLIVRKITRLSGQDTTWSSAGRADCIESRRF